MKILGCFLAGALATAPMLAGAVSIGPGSVDGTGVAGTMPADGTRFVVPFTVVDGFEAVLGISIAGVATGTLGDFSTALQAVQFGLSPNPAASVNQQFAGTDFIIPASAASDFADYDLFQGKTVNLIFELPATFDFGDETMLLTYAYTAELRPVSPVNPIPLPASAFLLLGGLGGLGGLSMLRGKKARA